MAKPGSETIDLFEVVDGEGIGEYIARIKEKSGNKKRFTIVATDDLDVWKKRQKPKNTPT